MRSTDKIIFNHNDQHHQRSITIGTKKTIMAASLILLFCFPWIDWPDL